MNRLLMLGGLLFSLAVSAFASADDVAAERARLANERIQAEEERRAREQADEVEQGRVEQQELEADSVASPPASRIEMSRALEQLRELGSLKDAGYLTDEEFQLLKKKILDGAL